MVGKSLNFDRIALKYFSGVTPLIVSECHEKAEVKQHVAAFEETMCLHFLRSQAGVQSCHFSHILAKTIMYVSILCL
jgi:hypothetical protein